MINRTEYKNGQNIYIYIHRTAKLMNKLMENGIKCSVCIRGDPIIKAAIIINKNSTLLWLMAIIPETDASVIKI